MNLNKFKKNLRKEFNDTFKDELEVVETVKIKRRRLEFKPAFAFMVAIVFGILVIQHVGIEIYNYNIENQNEKLINESDKQITKIDGTKDISSQLNYIKKEKKSILEYLLTFQLIGCGTGTMDDGNPELMLPMVPEEDGANGNSFNTNVQEVGIDEADIAKSDGKYIYSVVYNNLYVYDLRGKLIDYENFGQYVKHYELYIYNGKVVCVGYDAMYMYSFDGVELALIDTLEYRMYISSRLVNNELYIVTAEYLNDILDEDNVDNLYYDNCINPSSSMCLNKYNLDTKEHNKINVITSNAAMFYASENHFYIATRNYMLGYFTFITIIDYDLNPIGSITVEGTINNQFSMDEHNNYIRVVSTDTTKEPLNYNQISIFSLETLERVGYLNEGIGLERHVVKSVRYDEDTCYIVTYLNQDPLYEIDLSDVTNPKIVSIYEAPGYSSYLHTFEIDNQKYAFGIGYDDSRRIKISVYIDNGEQTVQIGKDVIIMPSNNNYDEKIDYYVVERPLYAITTNHKSLFIYNDNDYLYIGGSVGKGKYTVFKIDVTQEEHVVSVYKEYSVNIENDTRSFLIDDKLYVVQHGSLIIDDWR